MSNNQIDPRETAHVNPADSMDEVMRKYDRESNTRIWEGKPKLIVSAVSVLFSLYCIWSTLWSTADLPIRLSVFLGLVIVMGYLHYPAKKGHVAVNSIPWYDIVIMILGVPLFVSSFRRADELADAMDSRCYRGAKGRTRMKKLKAHIGDAMALLFWCAVTVGILFLKYNWLGWAFVKMLV